MSIPQAVHSQIPTWVSYFASQVTPEKAIAVGSILEGVFYSSIRTVDSQENRTVKWLCETAVSNRVTIQMLFTAANVATCLYYTQRIFNATRSRFSLPVAAIAAIAPCALNALLYKQADKILNSATESRLQSLLKLPDNASSTQEEVWFVHRTKIGQQVALALLAQNPINLAIDGLCNAHSFFKNAQLKWKDFTFSFESGDENFENSVDKGRVTYKELILPPPKSSEKKQCSICQLDGDEVDDEGQRAPLLEVATCVHHFYHKTCLNESIESQLEKLTLDGMQIPPPHIEYETNARGHRFQKSVNYTANLDFEKLPACPDCRDRLYQNDISIRVTDIEGHVHKASVSIVRPTNRQPIFEKVYAVYSAVQAALSYLQGYPELAPTIYKIQKLMLVTDLIGLAGTIYYTTKDKGKTPNDIPTRTGLSHDTIAFIRAGLFTVVSLVPLYFGVLNANRYLQPKITLKDLFPSGLNVTEISWNPPKEDLYMQTLHLVRIAATFALSFFSTQPKTNWFSTAAQISSLTSLSRLRWVQLTQLLESPLSKIMAEGGQLEQSSLFSWKQRLMRGALYGGAILPTKIETEDLKSLTVTSYFSLDRSCTTEPAHLRSALQAMGERLNSLFDQSTWSRYWSFVQTKIGVQFFKSLKFGVKLLSHPEQSCGCSLPISLVNVAIKGVDKTVGAVSVEIL